MSHPYSTLPKMGPRIQPEVHPHTLSARRLTPDGPQERQRRRPLHDGRVDVRPRTRDEVGVRGLPAARDRAPRAARLARRPHPPRAALRHPGVVGHRVPRALHARRRAVVRGGRASGDARRHSAVGYQAERAGSAGDDARQEHRDPH